MGFEAFNSLLLGQRNVTEVIKYLAAFPGVIPSVGDFEDGNIYYEYHEAGHLIEIEVSGDPDRTKISCRFALCHPSSVNAVFATFLARLATDLNMQVKIFADVPPGFPDTFQPLHLEGLEEAIVASVAVPRAQWKLMAGDDEAGVTTGEATRRFIEYDRRRGLQE